MPSNVPIACIPGALTPQEQARRAEVAEAVFAGRTATRELPDGYEVELMAATSSIMTAAEFIALERRCCPFLRFGLEVDEDGTMRLRLSGGPEVKAFLGCAMETGAASA